MRTLVSRYRAYCRVPAEAVVEVTVTSDKALAALNERYRRRRGPTDVLSFELGRDAVEPAAVWLWGEVYVSVERARVQAGDRGVTLQEELETLVAHGLLHLAGFGHGTPARRRAMGKAAAAILAPARAKVK